MRAVLVLLTVVTGCAWRGDDRFVHLPDAATSDAPGSDLTPDGGGPGPTADARAPDAVPAP